MRPARYALGLALLALTACAGKNKASAAPEGRQRNIILKPHVVRVNVDFEADYRVFGKKAIPTGAEIPSGKSPVRRTRVCLYEARGRNDFAARAHETDDRRLACKDTPDSGKLEFALSTDKCRKGMLCRKRLYLVTDMCVYHRGKAEVCVTANTQQGKRIAQQPWTRWAEFRKYMWSETYDVSLVDRTSTLITWNLSCPSERGEGRDGFRCRRTQPEGRWGRANSNYGYNKDAVHALQSGAQAIRRFGSLIPSGRNTKNPGGKYCGRKGDPTKKNFQCQDAMRLVLSDLRKVMMAGDKRCERWRKASDRSLATREACLANPMNPFIVVHEMGHLAHIRWMNYRGAINAGKVGWDSGTAQRSQVGEGWANFFAAAAWYPPEATAPTFNSRNIEDSSDAQLMSTCTGGKPVGEGRASQFFWDLYDAPNPAEPADKVQVDMLTLLKVWSMFRGNNDDTNRSDNTKGECGPHGRNVHDFLHYYLRYSSGVLPDPRALLPLNCVAGQLDGTKCSGKR